MGDTLTASRRQCHKKIHPLRESIEIVRMKGKDNKYKKLQEVFRFTEVRSWVAILTASRAIYRELELGLLSDNCSMPRFQILLHLYFDGPLAAVEISDRLLVTRGNITMFLRRLITDGIIKRVFEKQSSSKRKARSKFLLTPKGRRLFERIFPKHIGRVRRFMPPLPSQALHILAGIPTKLQKMLKRPSSRKPFSLTNFDPLKIE
ncbi:MAG: MarR family transcriptional regulator [Deltaproteobacteria bacterium]|nr:MarR family transcriptional regulator [Deltaproteobacteria bacterium]